MTTNQHYIPRFYQKYWGCETQGFVWELDKQHITNADKGITKQAIRSRNTQECLYEVDEKKSTNKFENWYREVEAYYADCYKRLVDSIDRQGEITKKGKLLLCKMFAQFSARNPNNLYCNPKSQFLAASYRLLTNNWSIDQRYLQNMIAFLEGGMGEMFDGISKSHSDFEKELLSYRLQILISDEPQIVFCNSITEQVCYWKEYYFPISPTMLASFSKSDVSTDMEIRKITSEEYLRFIRLYLRNPRVTHLFAKRRLPLDNCYELLARKR